jgi:hypothetical protein
MGHDLYCCYEGNPGIGGGTCVQDPSVVGCIGSDGYSCATGDQAPDLVDSALICSAPVFSGAEDLYCCYTPIVFPPGTCSYDASLDAACTPDSLGYSCAAGHTPEQTDPLLVCIPDPAGSGDYCCTIK